MPFPGGALGLASRVRLREGVELPVLGFGTWQLDGPVAKRAVASALDAGYRHIDTAALYGNEKEVGAAVRASGVERGQVVVTSKLWNDAHGEAAAREAFLQSADRLGLGTIDLFLVHWPTGGKRAATWRTLDRLQREGRCRAIGVSNFTERHLEELEAAGGPVRAVNQVEFSAFLFQKKLLDYCDRRGIQLVAYSPLTQRARLTDPRLGAIAAAYHRSPAQILIRWCLQHGVIPIPRSSSRDRIPENSRVFDFAVSDRDMAALDTLDEGFRRCPDPSSIP